MISRVSLAAAALVALLCAGCGGGPSKQASVQGVEHDAKDAAIAANLVSLAHALDVQAIAEGIESDGQCRELKAVGCDLAQGYLFARPAPADQITGMLAGVAARVREPGVEA